MTLSLVLAVIGGVLAWQFGHAVGAAPVLAGVLCAACFLPRRNAIVVGMGAMLVRDLLAGLSLFTVVRLVAMLGVVGIIWVIRIRPSLKSLLLGLGLSSPVYHLVLAVGDWITRTCSTAPFTPQGLGATIAGSMPYFQRSLVGDLLFTSAFLMLYTMAGYLAVSRWPSMLPHPSEG